MRRVLKWVWRGSLVLTSLLALTWTFALAVGSRRLDKALESARSDARFSKPWPQDWSRPKPGENAAAYFTGAFALVEDTDPKTHYLVSKVVNGGWDGVSEAERAVLRSWFSEKAAAIELAARGADRPRSWFVGKWSWDPWNQAVEHGTGAIRLVSALIARAWCQTIDGNHDEARESIRSAFAVADCFREDPRFFTLMITTSHHLAIQLSLLRMIPPEATAQDIEEWLRIIPKPDRFDDSLEKSIRWDAYVLVDLLSGPLDRFWHASCDVSSVRDWRQTLQRRLADPLVKIDGVRALKDLERMIEICRMPFADAKKEADQMMTSTHESGHSKVWHPVRRVFIVPRIRILPQRLEFIQDYRAASTVLRTGLEWELIRLRTGKYPERCEVIDPISGKPLLLETVPLGLKSEITKRHYPQGPISWVLRGK
ncbi:MAG TPA: hypothetical protein VGK61_02575 [Planctomycetota bacterium]